MNQNAVESGKKVSIVIPMYNAEDYIEQCINSVLRQTYNNVEIILVNDGSTDNTLEICREKAKKEKRIHVISKKNGGVQKARETGVLAATGDYIMFMDNDDFLMGEYVLKVIIEKMEQNKADIVCFNVDINGKKMFKIEKESILCCDEALGHMLIRDILDGNIWGKIYRTKLIQNNNVEFIDKWLCEFVTVGEIIQNAQKILVIPLSGYGYNLRKGSQSHSFHCNPKAEEYEHVAKEYANYINKKYPIIFEQAEYFWLHTLLYTMTKIEKDFEISARSERYKSMLLKLKGQKERYWKNAYISKREKIDFLLCSTGIFRILYFFYSSINSKRRK